MDNIFIYIIITSTIFTCLAVSMNLIKDTFHFFNKKVVLLGFAMVVFSVAVAFVLSKLTIEGQLNRNDIDMPSAPSYESSQESSEIDIPLPEQNISIDYAPDIETISLENIDANLKNGGIAYLFDNTIYFRNSNKNGLIYSFDIETHKSNPVGDIGIKGYSINVVDNRIYYVNKEKGNTIYEYNIEKNQSRQISKQSSPQFRVIGNRLYYISSDNAYGHRLFCIDLENSTNNIGQLVVDAYTYNISFVNDRLYYVPKISGGMLSSINLSNVNNPRLFGFDANFINIVNNTMIYQDPYDYKLYMYDGKNNNPLNDEYVTSVIVHNDRIYYSSLIDDEYGNIFSVDMDGNDKKQISTNPSFVYNIYDNYIFYYHDLEYNDDGKLENKLFLIELDSSGNVISESYFE